MAEAPSENFDGVLRFLRGLAVCEPPIGVGTFDLLYASEREIAVWYSPAREHQHAGEITIPCRGLAAAWTALTAGESLDEAALDHLGGSPARGRWLLALLAQLPGVHIQREPLTLVWTSPDPPPGTVSPIASSTPHPKRRARRRQEVVAPPPGGAPAAKSVPTRVRRRAKAPASDVDCGEHTA